MDLVVNDIAAGASHVAFRGRLDVADASSVEPRLRALLEDRQAIIVDLSELRSLGSAGVRILVVAAKALSAKAGKLVICSPNPQVAQVLAFAGIDALIPIYPDSDAAVSALAPVRSQ